MYTKTRKSFAQRFGLLVFSFGFIIMLAACGQASGGTGATGGGAVPTPVPTAVKGYGTAYGCPSDMVVSGIQKANVTVQAMTIKGNVAANTGDIIEVHLPFGQKWNGPTTSLGVLQLQDPAGYALKADRTCIWRFQAKASGSTALNFTGRAICSPGKMCPLYVESVSFTVDVK
jgi:hypothetical protein